MVTSDVGELLVIRRAIHAKNVSPEPTQGSKSSAVGIPLEARVCELIIDRECCTSVVSMTLIDEL